MLAQQISAVIVAVGRAHDDVNMIFVMLFVLGKGLAGLMIELDQQHRAMDAVIENAVFLPRRRPRLWFEAVCRPPRQAKN
jgi:hypothetical protein